MAPPPPVASPPPPPVEPTEAPIAAVHAEPAKPASSLPPVEKRSRGKLLAFVLLPALLLVGGGFVYQSQVNARASKTERAAPPPSAEATVEPPAPAPEPPPPPTAAADPTPSASAAKKPAAAAGAAGPAPVLSADPSKTGYLDTTLLPAGRKIVVDGRVVGTSPRRVVVRCGMHRIQIGDLPPESIQLPCGGEVTFTD